MGFLDISVLRQNLETEMTKGSLKYSEQSTEGLPKLELRDDLALIKPVFANDEAYMRYNFSGTSLATIE